MAMTITCPYVIPKSIRITKEIQKKAIKRVNGECKNTFLDRVELGCGPINCDAINVFGNDGEIYAHKDEAGYTYGLVLYAEKPKILYSEGVELEIDTGSSFLIDSDVTHGAMGGGLIIFATYDFFHGENGKILPTMKLEEFPAYAMPFLKKYL